MDKKHHFFKIFIFILSLFTLTMLSSCKKHTISNQDYDGVWIFKRDVIIVGGLDFCKYENGVVYVKHENDILYVSEIFNAYNEEEITQGIIDIYKDIYVEDYFKILEIKDNKPINAYKDDGNIFTGLKLYKTNVKKGLIEVTFKNDATGTNIEVVEVFIRLTKTNLT